MHTHTHIHPYIHTSIHPYIHTSIHPYRHTYIHAHTCIHTYILCHTRHHLSHTTLCHPTVFTSRSFTTSFVFPSFSVLLQHLLLIYWKKLACGVILSFNFWCRLLSVHGNGPRLWVTHTHTSLGWLIAFSCTCTCTSCYASALLLHLHTLLRFG